MNLTTQLRASVKHERASRLAESDALQDALDNADISQLSDYILARVRGVDWRSAARAIFVVDGHAQSC